jgi:polysaccharide deacetylase family protein (PEP-CTERM system associated)
MINALSIDVEDWFCVHNLSQAINRNDWDKCEQRIEGNLVRILDILDEKGVKATFFVLGWTAEHHPGLVEMIDKNGHEIGTHGFSHTLLTEMTPEQFRRELEYSLQLLERYTGKRIIGHRAPSFTVTTKTLWALDILADCGLKYDSSVFPVSFHPDYGISDAPQKPYKITESIWEFPLSVVRIMGRNIPVSGGGYFRLFPYRFVKYGINKVNQEERPVVFYLHPWEIDAGQPRVRLSPLRSFRHYHNLDKTEGKFLKLLDDFQFCPIREVLNL